MQNCPLLDQTVLAVMGIELTHRGTDRTRDIENIVIILANFFHNCYSLHIRDIKLCELCNAITDGELDITDLEKVYPFNSEARFQWFMRLCLTSIRLDWNYWDDSINQQRLATLIHTVNACPR